MRSLYSATVALIGALCLASGMSVAASAASLQVTRATLHNGLKVVVVTDRLAPVVTTMLNYKVGSDEQTIDGLAHAVEHMMFRGSKTLSSNQLMDTMSVMGGDFDADTQDAVTQYFFTVPSQYLDIALRLERSRATGTQMAQGQWNQERGAITQEVTMDNSNAIRRLFDKMTKRLLGGTPYAKNGLGTIEGFKKDVNSPQLLHFYNTWYHPNNAVYVIVGDVDGPSTIAQVKRIFGDIPAAKLPARPAVHFKPIVAKVYRDTSDQPFTLVIRGYRLPGYASKDYAAAQILSDVLSNTRSKFGDLAAAGKVFQAGFQMQQFSQASIGILYAAVPVAQKPEVADATISNIIADYQKTGVPADLVAAAKRSEIAGLEYAGNSISGLAFEWSQAIAVEGLQSPNDMKARFAHVSVADVNAVLRTYLNAKNSVAAYAVPKNNGKLSAGGSGGTGKEDNSIPPSKHEPLPAFAQRVLDHLAVPARTINPVDMMLPNGIRLIVQPESITNTVLVSGSILNNPQVQEPKGESGVNDVLTGLFSYGTTTYDRKAFATQADAIAATIAAGTAFSAQSLTNHFDRAVQLLADDELHPALPLAAFNIVKAQTIASLGGAMNAPDHLTEVQLAKALYPIGYPLTRFATDDSVRSLTLDKVKSWYQAAYRPDITTIVIVGDVTPEHAKATILKYFGGWTASGPKPDVFPPSPPINTASQVNVPAHGRVQSTTQLQELIDVRRTSPDFASLMVAQQVLSGGFYSSLLYHDLREVHGYVYNVGASFSLGKNVSSFSVHYGSDPDKVVPAENQITAILTQLQTKPVASDRLLRAKALLMGAVPLRMASYNGVAGLLGYYSEEGLPLNQDRLDAKAELETTAAGLQAAMAKWIRPNGFVRVVTGPPPK